MGDDAIDRWALGLLSSCSAQSRRKLAGTIATALRTSQQQRIAQQTNADGSPYAPRKPQTLRSKKGRIKRGAMFKKLRSSQFLRITADANLASVEFKGPAARIAQIHQDGLVDRVRPKGPLALYPKRQLLGFTAEDRDIIQQMILDALKESTGTN